MNEAERSGSSIGSRIGAGFAKVGKAVAVGIGAASTAVGALATMSVKGYADYEQLAGGVETLFKNSSQSVIKNASKAYETAGMSANEYMETVTGFSASLLQSLGGDTQKAAEKADTAIRDMSDNANKMGTDIESIQNAYQGFAKQNYTMLDNLKLGYGGTKEEMERLLTDAGKISGVKYDISSYADIVDAIHVVQTEMHISGLSAEEAAEKVRKGEMTQEEAFAAMGTTAKEASTTIQGSIQSAKSAWQNLITGLADDNANLDELVNNFFDSIVTVGDNIIPRISVILNGITGLIQKLAPKIIGALPGVLNKLLPEVVKGAQALLKAFVGVLPQLIKLITDALPDIIAAVTDISNAIVDALPEMIGTIANALPTLIPPIVTAITDMAVYLMEHISEIIQPIIDKLPDIIISIVNALMDNLPSLINGLIALTLGIVNAIPQIIMGLLQALPTIIEKIVTGLLNCLPQLIEGAIQVVIGLVTHLPEIIMGLIQAIPEIVVSIAQALIQAAPKIWEAFTEIFSKAWEKIQEVFSLDNVGTFFSGVWDGIKAAFSSVGTWFRGIFQGAVNGIKAAFNGIKTWFSNLWQGIWTVIKTPINWIIDGINTVIGGLNSLSIKVPDWVPFVGGQTWGVNIPKIAKLAKGGFVEGGTPFIAGEAGAEAVIPLENNNQWIYKFAHAFADGLSSFYEGNNFTQTPNKGAGGKVVNINLYLDNVNVKNGDDIEDVANKVSERIAEKLVVEGMAVG